MARQVYEYDRPERFVAGTVGEPGSRTFFLQARNGAHVTTVSLEKQQVAVLAERVDELLDDVLRSSGGSAPIPALTPAQAEDSESLDTPIEREFQVGTMSLAWDRESQLIVIECFEISGGEVPDAEDLPDSDEDATGAVLRVSLTGSAARAFAKRALAVVAAGRPPCPFCGNPLDVEGHICPRANGYRR
jgi:uncharacterized repeat protein (TIGR03847 family)